MSSALTGRTTGPTTNQMTGQIASQMTGPRPAGDAAAPGVLAADARMCASRSSDVQQLAARVARCADAADAVLTGLARLELQGWQSPAGRAYRLTVSLQAASLRRSRDSLLEAVAVVQRHAWNVALSAGRTGP